MRMRPICSVPSTNWCPVTGSRPDRSTTRSSFRATSNRRLKAPTSSRSPRATFRIRSSSSTMQLTAPNQVNLHVRVVEISRTALKEIGVTWSAGAKTQSKGNNGIGPPSYSFTATGTPAATIGATAANALNFLYAFGSDTNISATLDALETQGLATVLAEPNLTAISGQKASFLAGGEFPVPVPQSGTGGSAVVTIDYKKFGVSLSFLATILNSGRISLHVAPEVSQIDTSTAITVA